MACLIVIGPRIGRFSSDGSERKMPGSNPSVAMLGAVLLWFGWFGFNGGSTFAMDDRVPKIIANTVLAGAAGLAATLVIGFIFEHFEVERVVNGCLAGLVSITANCHSVTAVSAVAIGLGGGLVMLGTDRLLDKFKIDDAVKAVPVHLGPGIWGTLAVAIFGQPEVLGTGLTFGEQLGVQALGIVVCGAWAFGASYIILKAVDRIFPLRVSPEEEHVGLNISEHGASTELLELFRAIDHQSKTKDLSERVPVEPFTEVGQIAERYNRLMDVLEQAVARTVSIVKSTRDAIVTFSKEELVITTLNPAAESVFGYAETQLLNQPVTLLIERGGTEDAGARPHDMISKMMGSGVYHEILVGGGLMERFSLWRRRLPRARWGRTLSVSGRFETSRNARRPKRI